MKAATFLRSTHRTDETKKAHRNFTLIELLVVISIIAVLAGMLLPALNAARTKARTTSCISLQKQVGAGLLAYAVDSNGLIPGWNQYGENSWYATLRRHSSGFDSDPAKGATCPEYRAAIGKATDATNIYSVRAGIASGGMTPIKVYQQSSSKILMLAEGWRMDWNCPYPSVDRGKPVWHGYLSMFHRKTGIITFQDGHVGSLTAYQIKTGVYFPYLNTALLPTGVLHINPDFKTHYWEDF